MNDARAYATDKAPLCPEPDPTPRLPRGFAVPSGAVDAHAHVIGLPPAYPLAAARAYTAPPAPAERYLAMLDATGMAFGVLVQISVHGTDNRLMVETIAANRARLRGIAVVATEVADQDLRALDAAGVVGIRLNNLFGGGVGLEHLEALARRIAPLGWHIQLLIDARTLPDLAFRLRRLPVPFVIDHMGHMPASLGIYSRGFQDLLRLLDEADCWVKLSGAHRISTLGPPYADALGFARALIATRPERLVWGSDWPHVALPAPVPNPGDLLELLAEWAPREDTRNAILAHNAHRLYGFRTPSSA
ncbi:MAG: amidohydrolase family protein [Methylobacteriaceae bacterium]|nr:amidohydrolase family protein [Methylobacteriaceae bacterium]MBV9243930.1 amidohydrolase family protein [Methylobacteriaceae bacterium]